MRSVDVALLLAASLTAAQKPVRLPLTFEENQGQFPAGTRFVARSGAHWFSLSGSEAAFDGVRMRFLGADPGAPLAGVERLAARSNYLNGRDPRRWITDVPHYAKARRRGAYPGVDVLYYANPDQIEFDLTVGPAADANRIRLGFSGVTALRLEAGGDLRLRSKDRDILLRRPVAYQEIDGRHNLIPVAYVLEDRQTVRFRLGSYDPTRPLVIDPAMVYATFVGGSGSDSIVALATDPQNNLYMAGTTTSSDIRGFQSLPGVNTERQIALSTNGGKTWTNYADLPSGVVYSLAIDPRNPDTLYAGGYDTVYKSTDGAKTWRAAQVTFPAGAIFPPVPAAAISITGILAVCVDPKNSRNLYAARQPGGIIRSTDGGETWTPANTGLPTPENRLYISFLVADPFHASTLYTATFDGLFRSVDGASTWTRVSLGPGNVSRILFDPVTSGVLYAQAQNALLKSVDNGQNWAPVSVPGATAPPLLLAIDPASSKTLYAALVKGLGRSLDGGATWQSISVPGGYATALVIDPSNPQNLVASATPGLLRSTDQGSTWQVAFPAASRQVRSLLFDPRGNGAVYAAVNKASDLFVAKLNPAGDTLLYATYFGGNSYEFPKALAVDRNGNAVVVGTTQSVDFPVTPGALQASLRNRSSGFIARLNPAGDGLVFSSYLGGSGFDSINAVAADPAGNTYLTGSTSSSDFPVTPGAPQAAISGPGTFPAQAPDAFVMKLSPDGRLLYSTYLGGSDIEQGNSIVVDADGNANVAGVTYSTNFVVTSGAMQKKLGGASDAFLARFDPSGALLYATLLGGNNTDSGYAVALGPGGDIYLAGGSGSRDFPTTSGVFQSQIRSGFCSYSLGCQPGCIGPGLGFQSPSDAFVARLSSDGTALRWATFVGGECATTLNGLVVDSAGNAYFTGNTLSQQFPKAFAIENTAATCGQFVSVAAGISSTGSSLLFGTYLDAGSSPTLALDSLRGLYIGGQGCGTSMIAGEAFEPKTSDGADGYLVKIDLSTQFPIALNSAENAFSVLSGPVAPGELVMLHGSGIGPDAGVDLGINTAQPPTTTLAGVQVFFDDAQVPVMTAQSGWVICLAPYGLAGHSTTRIQVDYQGQRSNALQTAVAPQAPGLLTLDGSGQGQLNVRNQDGTLNSTANPANRGDVATLFATGLGIAAPAPDGTITGPTLARPQAAVRVLLGGTEAAVLDVTSVPGFVSGLFQIWVRVPREAAPGPAVQTSLSVGFATTYPQAVTMAIQ